jgi:hypothetical protein
MTLCINRDFIQQMRLYYPQVIKSNHHTLYIHTVMDPYTHILCLPLTFSCQTTFISGSSKIMNCVCPFLDYIDCTTMREVVRVLQYRVCRDTYLHRYTYTYTVVCHPDEFEFVFIFEIETRKFTSFATVRSHVCIRKRNLNSNVRPHDYENTYLPSLFDPGVHPPLRSTHPQCDLTLLALLVLLVHFESHPPGLSNTPGPHGGLFEQTRYRKRIISPQCQVTVHSWSYQQWSLSTRIPNIHHGYYTTINRLGGEKTTNMHDVTIGKR